MTQAVIFDMDGTLIDTEKYYRRFWPLALAQFGYEMTDAQALEMRSLGRPFAPEKLREWFGEGLDYREVRERRKELMEECLAREGIACKPGARGVLAALKERGVTAAVATATDPERTRRYLQQAGLDSYFDRVICATQVREGKPSPDIYLHACHMLGAAPEDCIAVEDSPNGVMSAFRAGCRVIMVPDQTRPDEKLAEMLFACVDALPEILDYLA